MAQRVVPGMKRAGQRNRLVTIERLTDADNGQGGQIRTWSPIGEEWVNAVPVGGTASLIAGTLQQQQPWRIEMLWRSDLTPQDRLTASWLPQGMAIAIDSVADPDGLERDLVIFGTASKI